MLWALHNLQHRGLKLLKETHNDAAVEHRLVILRAVPASEGAIDSSDSQSDMAGVAGPGETPSLGGKPKPNGRCLAKEASD